MVLLLPSKSKISSNGISQSKEEKTTTITTATKRKKNITKMRNCTVDRKMFQSCLNIWVAGLRSKIYGDSAVRWEDSSPNLLCRLTKNDLSCLHSLLLDVTQLLGRTVK